MHAVFRSLQLQEFNLFFFFCFNVMLQHCRYLYYCFLPWGHEQSTTLSFALPLTSPLPSEKRKNGQKIMKLDWGESRWRNYQDKPKHTCNKGVASLSSLASIIGPIGINVFFLGQNLVATSSTDPIRTD